MLLVSSDSKYLFSVNGTRLNVYSVTSGEILYRLSYNDNDERSTTTQNINSESLIKSICINPLNKYQLFSFHLSGHVCLWDYEDGLLMKTYETNLNIKKVLKVQSNIYVLGTLKSNSPHTAIATATMVKGNKKKSTNLLSSVTENEIANTQNGSLSLYKLMIDSTIKNKISLENFLVIPNLNINENKLQIDINYEEKYAAYIEGRKSLVVTQFKSNNLIKKFTTKLELTCLAMHPNEDCIVTGTSSGKIIIWYNHLALLTSQQTLNLNEADSEDFEMMSDSIKINKKYLKASKPTKTILHWHSLSVLSLAFSTDGSYLLSGGHECVLVKWLLRTGQKDFKPRLGAPISEITSSIDNKLYVTRHLDNTIHLLGTNLQVLQTLGGLICPNFTVLNTKKQAQPEYTFYQAGLSYFPRLNCVVTNGKPGHLQFYSFTADKLIFNLDIVDENYISPENLERPSVHTEIESLVFNHDSSWLVTVERRDDKITTAEIKLKFWRYDQINNKFSLNTLVRYPHSFEKVNRINFKPGQNVLFTCGNDGCFKSWSLAENKQKADMTEPTWNWEYNTCNGYRDMSPNYLEFTELNNKNLIAVSFNHIVTLWNYEENGAVTFRDDLIHCDVTDAVRHVRFMDENNLVVAHRDSINVWRIEEVTNSSDLTQSEINKQLNSQCVWTGQVDDVVRAEVLDRKLVLIMRKLNESKNEDAQVTFKIALFELDKSGKPLLDVIHSFHTHSFGYTHFLCIPRSEISTNTSHKIDSFLESTHIYYCDNKGVLKRLTSNGMKEENSVVLSAVKSAEINTDLNESMWSNRKVYAKNLPQSNLSTIIDLHKSNKFSDESRLILEEQNEVLSEHLSRIELTPAYLMPKVNTFCLEALKSMLHKYDDSGENLALNEDKLV